MLAALRTLFSSKKFQTFIIGLMLTAGARFGLQLDGETCAAILGLVGILIGAQGLQDHGKEAAKITAEAPSSPTNVQNTTVVEAAPSGGSSAAVALVLFVALGAMLAVLSSSACGGRLGDAAGGASHGFVDCMKPEPQKMLGELRPVFQDVIRNATGGDGKVDRDALRAAGMSLASDATRCAFSSVIAEVLRPHSIDPNAPQSAALEVDQAQLRAEYDAIRDDFWGGQSFKLEAPAGK